MRIGYRKISVFLSAALLSLEGLSLLSFLSLLLPDLCSGNRFDGLGYGLKDSSEI